MRSYSYPAEWEEKTWSTGRGECRLEQMGTTGGVFIFSHGEIMAELGEEERVLYSTGAPVHFLPLAPVSC